MSVTRRRAAVTLAVAATAGLAAVASAATRHPATTVVKAAHNSHQNKSIVVDVHGNTLYRLTGDTPRHVLCTHRRVMGLDCLVIWKPLTVRSSSTSAIKAGSGVSGALTLLRRGRNSYQVVLRGMPLYTYVGDSRRGDVNGEGIRSFGGVWHTVPASTRRTTPTPAPMPTPTTTYPTTPY
jgi:predicted lipoprotein with Yx(FWY)xxD motif